MKLHLSVGEYEFVEVEFEETESGLEGMHDLYHRIKERFRPKPINELPAKEWDTFLVNQFDGVPNHTETIERMSPAQKKAYNDNKRALNRIAAREERNKVTEEDLDKALSDLND